MAKTEQGYFLVADITGYTAYLSQSELDHAQDTLTSLLNLLIRHTRPPLVISRLAGDAVISYGLKDHFLQGQTLIELIEETYVAFRRALELMVLNTTCECAACKNLGTLDLKFFVHYGAFGIQKLDAHEELVGADVIVLHRLLKNRVTETTGARAYALYTDAAIQQLGLQAVCSRMTPHEEEYEHLGKVKTWIQDMHPIWQKKREQSRIELPPDQVLMQVSTEIGATPEQVWDFLIQPEHFNVFATGTRTAIQEQKDGRVTEGTVYQCYHGNTILPLTVLSWEPFERIVLRATPPIPVKGTTLLIEVRLEPTDDGTRFVQVFGKASGPWAGRVMANLMFRTMAKAAQRDVDTFRDHVKRELAGRGEAPRGTAPEPGSVLAAALASLQE